MSGDKARSKEVKPILKNLKEAGLNKPSEGGWARTGDVEYEVALRTWEDAREPVSAAMLAAFTPLLPAWAGDLTSSERADAYDPARRHVADDPEATRLLKRPYRSPRSRWSAS